MTDEARNLFYSPAHWRKMASQQLRYITNIDPKDRSIWDETWRRYSYIRCVQHTMSRKGNPKSIIINGINYGLMLEGLRNKLHRDIDERANIAFAGLVRRPYSHAAIIKGTKLITLGPGIKYRTGPLR